MPFGCWLGIACALGGAVGGGLMFYRLGVEAEAAHLNGIVTFGFLVVGVPVGILFGSLSAMLLAFFLKWLAERGDEGGF
jgi:hypothetical protein